MKKSLPFLLAMLLTGCSVPGNWGGLPLTGSETFTADEALLDAQYMKWWQGRPVTQPDVEFLARAISAEARGEVTRYKKTGDGAVKQSVSGVAYVIARTAAVRKTSVEGLIKGQSDFLSSWHLKNQAGNAENYRQFFLPTQQIVYWNELCGIAREALSGKDPTGIDPNHFYDVSIAHRPPRWAIGPGISKRQLGKLIFIYTPKDI
jgi:hypothetical protein